MTEETVTPEDIQRKLEQIGARLQQQINEPNGVMVRNAAIALAVVVTIAFLAGRSTGKSTGMKRIKRQLAAKDRYADGRPLGR